MARPLRNLWRDRVRVRRRHRTWVQAMVLATLGWSVWWATFWWWTFSPDSAPALATARWVALPFGVSGLGATLWGFRAKSSWLLLLAVPLAANASLVCAPFVLDGVARALQGPR